MATIHGTDNKDTLVGTLGSDRIFGYGKSDKIYADPTVFDSVGGDDFVDGGSGDDVIYTFGGNDTVYGGPGNDQIFTADGNDVIYAGPGHDDVQSGRGQDIVYGGDGNDALRGGEGNDYLYGEAGDDRVIGGSDNDTLSDGPGVDRLEGRAGFDTILLDPDRSTDTVVFTRDDVGKGFDTIIGFDPAAPSAGGDLLDLSQIAGQGLRLVQNGADVQITAGSTLVAVVKGVTVDQLRDNILDGGATILVAGSTDGSGDWLF